MSDKSVESLLEEIRPPKEAIEAFPDECANCGASAAPVFIPDDYHEQPHHKRDPGICTSCGHHFGSGKP